MQPGSSYHLNRGEIEGEINIFNIWIKSCNLFALQYYHGKSIEDNVPKKTTWYF